MKLSDPHNAEHWLEISRQREKDAKVLQDAHYEVSAVYMACYVIETALKAYQAAHGDKPKHEHCLRKLFSASSGLTLNILHSHANFLLDIGVDPDSPNDKACFTKLRYQTALPTLPCTVEELLKFVYMSANNLRHKT